MEGFPRISFPKKMSFCSCRTRLSLQAVIIVMLAPIIFSVCSMGGGEYIATLAKLHNLKVAMSYMTQFVQYGDRQFPKTPQEIIDFMEKEAGIDSHHATPKMRLS